MKKLNWKASLLQKRNEDLKQAESLQKEANKKDPKMSGRMIYLLGRVHLAEEMLQEYKVSDPVKKPYLTAVK